jgi:hypothetical protein
MVWKLLQDSVGSFDTLLVLLQLILSLEHQLQVTDCYNPRAHKQLFEEFSLFVGQLPMLGLDCHPVCSPL